MLFRSEEDEISLADYCPFDEIGEYRCNIARRVYDTLNMKTKAAAAEVKGVPVDLVAPEFRFRVESLKHIKHPASPADEMMRHGDTLDGFVGETQQTSSPAHPLAPMQPATIKIPEKPSAYP